MIDRYEALDVPKVVDDIELLPVRYEKVNKLWKEKRNVHRISRASYTPEGKRDKAIKKSPKKGR